MKYHFDIKSIRDDPTAFDAAMVARGHQPMSEVILKYDDYRRKAQTEIDRIRNLIKDLSNQIGQAMKAGDHNTAGALKAGVAVHKGNLLYWENTLKSNVEILEYNLLQCPNVAASEVPEGKDESQNLKIREYRPYLEDLKVGIPHWEMDLDFGMDAAAKISGARFSMLGGGVARLHRALGQFMLDRHIARKFKEVIPPVIVNAEALYGTAQLPKFGEDLFAIAGEEETTQYLIPTGEVPLTNIVADSILIPGSIHRFVALTECFRAEAGSAGRDTRGLIRQHQFQKVELVTICEPHKSVSEHEYMAQSAEAILEALELPYRRMLLCKGDMGFAARKTWDLEVWLPGQQAYREISSISNCGDFQARRMNTRYKVDGQTVYAHTLNGSGLAVGRTLVAVLENYWIDDDIRIPEVLRPYMGDAYYLSELG
jgi:seryl-tRNA synthetase